MAGIYHLTLDGQLLAAAGSFPVAFAAVYVFGAIAAFGIGFMALKKARSVNAEQIRDNADDSGD